MFFPKDYEVDDADHMVPLGLITNYHVKNTFKATALLIYKLMFLILIRLSKSWFTRMYRLRLAENNSTNLLFYFSVVIGG